MRKIIKRPRCGGMWMRHKWNDSNGMCERMGCGQGRNPSARPLEVRGLEGSEGERPVTGLERAPEGVLRGLLNRIRGSQVSS